MVKEIISSDKAPKAIGPYSQAIMGGGLLFCSGQIALDPMTGNLRGTNIAEQTEQVMANIEAVLSAAGGGFEDVVKSTIYLTNLVDFTVVNEIYEQRFTSAPPARSTVEVKGLPKGANVEIEVIALTK